MQRLYTIAALAAFGLALVGGSRLVTAQSTIPGPVPLPKAEPAIMIPDLGKLPDINPVGEPLIPDLKPPMPLTAPATPLTPAMPKKVEPVKAPAIGMDVTVPGLPPMPTMPKPLPATSKEAKPLPATLESQVPQTLPVKNDVLPAKVGSTKSDATANSSPGTITASAGKQEPSVSLEWIGPAAAKLGQPADYVVLVRNTGNSPVQKVIVQARITGADIAAVEPKGEQVENVLLWELGNLMPRQEKPLKVKLQANAKGEISCQAWITLTGASMVKLPVREPKLLVKAKAPEKVLVGDPANIVLEVSNPGDHPAESVRLTATLPEGLESARGNKLNFDLGNLAAGETRSISIACGAKVAGAMKCEIYAEADGGLKSTDTLSMNIIMPKLDLEVSGPAKRYLGRPATYTFKLTNPGDAPAVNVYLTQIVAAGFKYVKADNLGQHDYATRTVKWFIPEIAPGESKSMSVELTAEGAGEQIHRVVATAARGMKVEKQIPTTVEGLSAIQMEVRDSDDPIEVKAETTYEIVLSNTGSKTESDVKLVCTIPAAMKVKSAEGTVRYNVVGNELVFEPLPKLAPKADVVYRIRVIATGKGDHRFNAQITSANTIEPLIKTESTRVYED